MENNDTLFEKLWYPSKLNALHVFSAVFAVATLVVAIVLAV
jgi:hypothetical protein